MTRKKNEDVPELTTGREYVVNGRNTMLYTIGELCKRLKRQNQTLRKWERMGAIPPAQYRSRRGRRLYTEAQIQAIVDAVKRYNIKFGHPLPAEMKAEIFRDFYEVSQIDSPPSNI